MCPQSSATADAVGNDRRVECDSRRRLSAEIIVEGSDCACLVAHGGDGTSPIEHHVIDDTCHVTSRCTTEDSAVHYRQRAIDGECICRIVASHGCNPSLQAITDHGVLVRTNPPDRETLRDVVTDLREIAESVRLQQLVIDSGADERRSELVNLENMTDIERETIQWAIVAGYYDRPRTIEFEELAHEIGISKSALSKRLSSAEAKVMQDLFSDEI